MSRFRTYDPLTGKQVATSHSWALIERAISAKIASNIAEQPGQTRKMAQTEMANLTDHHPWIETPKNMWARSGSKSATSTVFFDNETLEAAGESLEAKKEEITAALRT